MDARQKQIGVKSFEVLEPVDYGFRNYLRQGIGVSVAALLIGKAHRKSCYLASTAADNHSSKQLATDFINRYENNTSKVAETCLPPSATTPICD